MTKSRKTVPPLGSTLEEKVRLYARRRAEGKRAYARADVLMEEIFKQMKVGQIVGGWRLDDNFASNQKVFRSHGISHYELKWVDGE